MESVTSLITTILSIALPSLVALYVWWFKREYERKEKDKAKEAEVATNAYRQHTGIVYRYLNKLLVDLDCARVEILQPHPTLHKRWISVSFVITSSGVNDTSRMFQSVEMKDVAGFVGEISTRPFICWKDIHECKDSKIRSHCLVSGNEMVMIQRLEDANKDWIGNILVSFLDSKHRCNIDYIKREMQEAAEAIQYVLPEYKV